MVHLIPSEVLCQDKYYMEFTIDVMVFKICVDILKNGLMV